MRPDWQKSEELQVSTVETQATGVHGPAGEDPLADAPTACGRCPERPQPRRDSATRRGLQRGGRTPRLTLGGHKLHSPVAWPQCRRVGDLCPPAPVCRLDALRVPSMRKQTILFLAANPRGTNSMALDREAHAIQVELERSRWRDSFEFVTWWAAEPVDLLRQLRRLRPTVVQFSGHCGHNLEGTLGYGPASGRDVVGGLSPPDGEPCAGLFCQDASGRPMVVSASALRDTFEAAGSSVRLVVLNACYSEPAAEALLAHVDCVVGMAGTIRDDAARSFAVGFYGGLGERESVEAAFRGRGRVSRRMRSDRPQWPTRRRPAPASARPHVAADRLILGPDAAESSRS